MLRFPSTHYFAQFAGYPSHLLDLDGAAEDACQLLGRPWRRFDGASNFNSASNKSGTYLPGVDKSDGIADLVPGVICSWTGFCGGGILAVPNDVPLQTLYQFLCQTDVDTSLRFVYGTYLENYQPLEPTGLNAGNELKDHVVCVEPAHVPESAVRYGLAAKVPKPTVKVTIEHLAESDNNRWLLVVPTAARKRPLKYSSQLQKWFATFGMTVEESMPVSAAWRIAMSEWFGDAQRPMSVHRIRGGPDDAAWQLAVTNYVADHWSIQERGLDSVHVLACIERAPGLRRYWTSNR